MDSFEKRTFSNDFTNSANASIIIHNLNIPLDYTMYRKNICILYIDMFFLVNRDCPLAWQAEPLDLNIFNHDPE